MPKTVSDKPKPTKTRRRSVPPSQPPIWEKIQRLMQSVSDDETAKLPTDGAAEHDHYLYGTAKKGRS